MQFNHKEPWQQALIQAVTNPEELLSLLALDPALLPAAYAAAATFPLVVPRGFIARMKKSDPNDPLLRQVLPLAAELLETVDYSKDPLKEAEANPIPGLLHKYHGRVLVTLAGTCAINCRFCFRRHFPYSDNNPGTSGWDSLFAYLAADKTISEVILSGGDPLVVNDQRLKLFSDQLNQLPHITRLRFHSRIPIVLPERITPSFIAWISGLRQKPIMVVHCNHPNEIDAPVRAAMQQLQQAGVVLLNQTVLLRGVNDDLETLVALSEALISAGIVPYYLHRLDKVQGIAHFDLDIATSDQLYTQLVERLSGYLVPKFVCEQPGLPAKLLLSSGGLFTGEF